MRVLCPGSGIHAWMFPKNIFYHSKTHATLKSNIALRNLLKHFMFIKWISQIKHQISRIKAFTILNLPFP